MKSIIRVLLAVILVFSLTACGDSFKQGMNDAMKEESQKSEESKETEKESESQEEENIADQESQDVSAETVVEYDNLQKVFLALRESTKPGDVERMIGESELKYTVEEYNSSSGKEVVYQLAYTDGAALQKYAESGDHLEISFGGENKDEFMYAQYVNAKDVSYTALLYNHGTWYKFSDDNAEDYKGYYINDSFSGKSGITVKYTNGNEAETDYLPCDSGEDAIQKIIKKISDEN